jgi:ketosteroid isomerase-like protein
VSETNADIVRGVFEPLREVNLAVIDWGLEGVREMLGQAYSDDVELTTLASGVGTGVDAFYRGPDGVVRYLREWMDPFAEYFIDNLDYIEVGSCVLVPSRQRGVGEGSGARVELELTTLFELRDGRIARVHQYDTLDEARRDAEAGT